MINQFQLIVQHQAWTLVQLMNLAYLTSVNAELMSLVKINPMEQFVIVTIIDVSARIPSYVKEKQEANIAMLLQTMEMEIANVQLLSINAHQEKPAIVVFANVAPVALVLASPLGNSVMKMFASVQSPRARVRMDILVSAEFVNVEQVLNAQLHRVPPTQTFVKMEFVVN